MNTAAQPIEILLVDDDNADVELSRLMLRRSKVANNVRDVGDGVAALELLRDPASTRTDLLLLDLNMPRMDGHELLAILKDDEQLCSIPVVVMTRSQQEADVLRSYQLHANAYVTKPIDLAAFSQVVTAINDFWFQLVRLPSRPDPR